MSMAYVDLFLHSHFSFLHNTREKLKECLRLHVTHVGPARVVLTDHGAQSFRQSVCHGLVPVKIHCPIAGYNVGDML